MIDPDPCEIVRFAKLVKLMRSLQARYFAGDRSPEAIAQAKDAERRVDRAVGWILDHRQPALPGFEAENGPRTPQNGPRAPGRRITPPEGREDHPRPPESPQNRN